MSSKIKNFSRVISLVFFSLLISLIFCEMILRVKHHIIPNYDIEMWKYAKFLKIKSENKKIGHTHRKNKSAILQKIEIKTNSLGQRDVYIDNELLKNYERSFLFLGSSIILGWGVENSETLSNQLNKISNKNNKPFYDLISKFKEKTGCPVLVNTSFNVRGEPIVNTPKDAFNCFMGTELDYLIIGNCVLDKTKQDLNLKKDYTKEFELD